MIDMEGTVRFWSRGAEAMLGYSKSRPSARSHTNCSAPSSRSRSLRSRAELMRVGHWEGDLIKTAQDGRRVVVAGRWALQWGKRDQTPRVLVINSDITERKRGRRVARPAKRTTAGAG